MDEQERTYTEEEFAEILRRAGALSMESEAPGASVGRLTLDDMRAIATEAGLDPDLVERAVHLLPARRGETAVSADGTTGGGGELAVWFPVQMNQNRADYVLAAIRAATRQQGSGEATSSGLVWTAGPVVATVHGESEGSQVQVTASRTMALLSSPLIGLVVGLFYSVNTDEPIASIVVGLTAAIAVGVGTELSTRKRLRAVAHAVRQAFEGMSEAASGTIEATPRENEAGDPRA